MYRYFLKNLFDKCFAFILLVILFPLVFILSILIFLDLKENPFFFQLRLGHLEIPFYVIKFKTMRTLTGPHPALESENLRMTFFSNIVRRFSLDELPQLINILIGNMSFIGPRPFLAEYKEHYSPEERRRHSVKPGITGWAQVNGRNALTWKEKFKLDLIYINNVSFLLDIKIVVLTFIKILSPGDVNKSSHITMEKFNGRN